ncbi:MAG: plasmid recombination protein [Aquamicrobium sp.]|uniref:plasmid recombination protein n=1 Tax=Aquamicrobium sp. TaxID=1872579 RepID=UPI00349E827D|nr:plasmid recombination protein [Aquamicrobium sp.]
MSYQFVHMEVYSRKGRDGRNVDFVLAEAARRPDACLHVENPASPEVVFGVDVDEVRRLHEERAASAKATLANGKQRAIRQDQNTLVTIVASHPAAMDLVAKNPSLADEVRAWEVQTVAWLRDQYGSALVSVIRHVDESHPHLHAFILPETPDLRAGSLHPGQEAKHRIVTGGAADGEDGKALNRRADVAYRQALRDWQDSYWQAVGLPSGLTRLGPGRRRLTREEWRAERVQAQAVRIARERADHLQRAGTAFMDRTRAEAAAALAEATQAASRIRDEAIARQRAALRLHDEADARVRMAGRILSRARRDGARVLEAARAEATRLATLGSRIRSLWDGLLRSRLEARLRQIFETEAAAAKKQAEDAKERAAAEVRKRQAAERSRDAAMAAAQALGRERDAARNEVAAIRNAHTYQHQLGARP